MFLGEAHQEGAYREKERGEDEAGEEKDEEILGATHQEDEDQESDEGADDCSEWEEKRGRHEAKEAQTEEFEYHERGVAKEYGPRRGSEDIGARQRVSKKPLDEHSRHPKRRTRDERSERAHRSDLEEDASKRLIGEIAPADEHR